MKRTNILLGIGCILLLTILYFILFSSSNNIEAKYGNQLNYAFKTPNTPFIKSLNLESFELEFNEASQLHFDSLSILIKDLSYPEYQSKNNWQTAIFKWDGKTIQVKVRLHGRTPIGHDHNGFKSFAIKSSIPIKGQKRFNLIIYERIGVSADRINLLGREFNLITQPNTLIELKVNNYDTHLYYFETPLKNEYLSQFGMINFEIDDLRSPILHPQISLEQLNRITESHILKSEKDIENAKTIIGLYTKLNNAIAAKNSDTIHNFFEPNYIARFQCAREVAGLTNHGFSPENFCLAVDTSTMLFFPILHRDNYFGEYDLKRFNKYESGETIELLELISKNNEIKKGTNSFKHKHRSKIDGFGIKQVKSDSIHNKIYR